MGSKEDPGGYCVVSQLDAVQCLSSNVLVKILWPGDVFWSLYIRIGSLDNS